MKTITTAIVYPNARIHVGWAWECLGADWLARGLKAFGSETFFVTGMDEHSINVERAAQALGLSPKSYCDQMARDIKKVLKSMGMSYDRFIRTSDPDHERVVQALVKKVYEKSDIYQARYEGPYCDSCEAYYTEKDLVDGLCPKHKKAPRHISEENYFFKLSKYEGALLELFERNPDFLRPESRRSEVLNFIKSGLKDFSISRSSFTWGIPLSFDPKHVIYVWFDALINYLTACGLEAKLSDPEGSGARFFDSRWSSALHIIGKDISRFHCVFWPAMLMSMELPLPRGVFAHGWMTLKGEKMSKSSGNVVAPDDVIAFSGPDPFRYFLLAENPFSGDGNFSWEALVAKNNADLANDWGNLVNRSISMARKYFPDEELGPPERQTHSREVAQALSTEFLAELQLALDAVDPQAYALACTKRSRVLNLYIDQRKPWALAKSGAVTRDELREVIYTLLEGVRFVATAFLPLLPFRMPEVFRQLGVSQPPDCGAVSSLRWGEGRYRPGAPSPIYPRLELI